MNKKNTFIVIKQLLEYRSNQNKIKDKCSRGLVGGN